MSKVDKLLTFYRQVLTGLNCNVTEDGMVQFVTPNVTTPVTVGEKELRLALPIESVLNELSRGSLVAMHPMCENIILGQSPVIAALRNVTIESLTLKIASTMLGITMAIADGADMSATQIKFASDFDKVDEKTVKALTRLIGAIDPSSEHRLVNLYLKHGGIVGDNSYKRVATVTFPIYGELLEATDTVFGVKMRKQDVKLIRMMLEKIFPDIGEKDGYSFGSNSLSCPYFHALLNGFANVVEQLNKVTYTFRKIIREYTGEEPHVTLDYIHEFEEGKAYRDILPPLAYNQGTEAGGTVPTTNNQDIEHGVPLRQDYQEQINTPPPPIPQPQPMAQPQMPQYPTMGYGAPAQPAPKRTPISTKIKQIGATDEELAQQGQKVSNQGVPATAVPEQRDLTQMMYPPELYPQMNPQYMMQQPSRYPKFGGGQQQTPQSYPQQMPQIPQPYPQPMQHGYVQPMSQQVHMQPMPVVQPSGYMQQQMQQGYVQPMMQQGYVQPMPQQGYMQPPQPMGYPKF